ncbi:hypothetical protein [Xanthobacter flavus]|uniref:hypothetical protein n=1 Tax=Xanthobacter flavus TaxID=281 RepID=UPI00372BBBB4
MSYVIAFYEVDKAYGGPEEGGWWFDTGTLVRVFAVSRSETRANAIARRANGLLARLQRSKRSVGSVLYDGGRHEAHVYENTAPAHFPDTRPHYE